MLIYIIDDERLALENLKLCIKEAVTMAEVEAFSNADTLISAFSEKSCDVIFMDIHMPDIDGVTLAWKLKEINPKVNIIFVTGYDEYMQAALKMRASGYILKPATVQDVKEELDNLRFPVREIDDCIFVHTFGNFDLFVNGELVKFSRKYSKEIFAYLIDKHGDGCTISEMASVIFEDMPYDRSKQKQMQVYISDMMKTLKSVGAEHIVNKTRNSISVNINEFVCDYYSFLNLENWAVNDYKGEYMLNYSWAEVTSGWLDKKRIDKNKFN